LYKIKWDKKNNGIILSNNIKNDERIFPPRPVYHEELDLFGFDKFWEYEKSNFPLLWASGREYYYKGILVAILKGGNVNSKPELEVIHKGKLEPIKMDNLLKKNIKQLITLDTEAKEFINKIYLKYKNNSFISVAFSGGKDSQVIIDLVSQVIPPDEYLTIFTNTGMEIPFTLQTVEKTKKSYSEQYPGFRLFTNEPGKNIFELWESFGPPSRATRWCCSVCKTTPFTKFLKDKTDKPIIDIEGVREDESYKRSNYSRIYKGKHFNVTNVHPIFNWNTTEVFSYLYYRNIKINPGYRFGLWRIGCALCPFSSPLSEYIINRLFPDFIGKFINTVSKSLIKDNVAENKLKSFIAEKNWAKISRNASLVDYRESYDILYNDNDLIFSCKIKLDKILNWMRVLLNFKYSKKNNENIGNFKYKNSFINFHVKIDDEKNTFTFINEKGNIMLIGLIKRIMNKSIFCVQCNSCAVECPQGAISFSNDVIIDERKCIHCLLCITKFDSGCLNAKSRRVIIDGGNMKTSKSNINRYWGFGLKQEWLENFLDNLGNWISDNNLGSIQKKAVKNWLRDATLIDIKNEISYLSRQLHDNSNLNLSLQIIWTILCENSLIMKWYSNQNFIEYTKEELLEKLSFDFHTVSERTRLNALNAVISTLDGSNWGQIYNFGILTKKGRSVKSIYKKGTNNIDPIAIIYCLYRYAEKNGYYDFTLSELYEDGIELTPYRIFGIEKDYLSKILIGMQENKNRIISVEFAANLDNIFLNNEYSSIETLELLLEKKGE